MTLSAIQKPIFIFAGELSGDMHGSRLLKALRKHAENLQAVGVVGPELRQQGIDPVLRMEDFSVMGFSDVVWSLPKLLKKFNRIRDYILEKSPELAIFIDSPSFSLRMARVLRKRGYKGKLVQYISPTVWAWGKHRIQEMANTLDLLLTIYPFEKAYFSDTKLRVEYVGNPLLEMMSQYNYDPNWKTLFGLKNTEHLIGLFPGSRSGEIRRNLPKQLEAAKLIQKQHSEATFAISCAHEDNMPLVQEILNESRLQHNREVFFIPKSYSYDLMRSCRSAIAKSGTVTLELALHQCPTVVVYELTLLNRLIAKYALKVNLPHYCIVNILAEKRIFPELIERGFSPENLHRHLDSLHNNGLIRESCLSDCTQLKDILKGDDASERAAKAIANLF